MRRKLLFVCVLFVCVLFCETSNCASESQYTSLHIGGLKNKWTPDSAVTYRTMSQSPMFKRFKLFLPEGTQKINLSAAVDQGNSLNFVFVARLGQPPTSTTIPSGTLNNNGFTVQQLEQTNCFGKNSSGYLRIAIDQSVAKTNQWLYVDILKTQGNIKNINSTTSVDPNIYRAWYNKTVWDSLGDPVQGVISLPTPTPISLPVPTPISTLVVDICVTKDQYDRILNGAVINWIIRYE